MSLQEKERKALLLLQPIPVWGGGAWGAPSALIPLILRERLEAVVDGTGWPCLYEKASNAEVASLLFGASLEAPLDSLGTTLCLYAATQAMKRVGVEAPEDIRVEPEDLTSYERSELADLKRRLRNRLLKEAKGCLRDLMKKVPKAEREGALELLLLQLIDQMEKELEEIEGGRDGGNKGEERLVLYGS